MQLKWILAIIITSIVVGVTGNTLYDYKQKTNKIAAFLSGYGSSFVIDYDNIKMSSLGSDVFTIKNLSLTSNNIKLNSENASVNINDMAGGKITLFDTHFSYFDYRGDAKKVHFNNLSVDKIDKDISVQLEGMNLSRKGQVIQNGSASIALKQAYDNLQIDANVASFDGDDVFISIKSKMDKASVEGDNILDGLYSGNIVNAKATVKSVTIFGKLIAEYPDLHKDINDFGVSFATHHYPKSKAEGLVLLDFLKNQKTLSVSIEPKAPVAPKHLQVLKQVDSLTLFEQLNLNIRK
ncbi:hypothetical protein LMH73_010630 [Vibrio splendidus]|nr:hypothetical protein [Vibrio splendidus]MCC4880402.1 hypothetical protein [Vibrio splendidus]